MLQTSRRPTAGNKEPATPVSLISSRPSGWSCRPHLITGPPQKPHSRTRAAWDWFRRMGSGMGITTCSLLLLLMLLPLGTRGSYADRFGRFRRMRGGFGFANSGPVRHSQSVGGEGQKEAGGALGDEKRMVSTGPNPLHNR